MLKTKLVPFMDFKNIRFFFIIISSVCLGFVSCKKDEPVEFDRGAMLDNMAFAVIKPQLTEMSTAIDNLDTYASTFVGAVSQSNLENLRGQLYVTYIRFQRIKMFDFGPIMDYGIKSAMNTYPTDTAQIESNILSGSYLLESAENIDAIGLPALDYLLFYSETGTDNEVLNRFTIDPNFQNYQIYLTDLTSKMKSEFELAYNNWDSYANDFVTSDGNDAGSSTSLIFNQFLIDLELIKNAKIGIPSGQQTGGATLPSFVEAYYANTYSAELAIENLRGLQHLFNGGSGKGFDDYIKDVEDESITESLADKINNQFDHCINLLTAINGTLSNEIETNNSAISEIYQEIKKLVTYCKTDMASILGLLVTYQDNDGD